MQITIKGRKPIVGEVGTFADNGAKDGRWMRFGVTVIQKKKKETRFGYLSVDDRHSYMVEFNRAEAEKIVKELTDALAVTDVPQSRTYTLPE